MVLHCHATRIYDVGNRKVRIIREFEQVLFRPVSLGCSSLNLACSENAGKYLFGSHVFRIIHNGIDLSRFLYTPTAREKIRKELNLDGKKVIGHIGRFSQEKNHVFLLKVLKALLKIDSEYRLLCVGSGDLFDRICDLAGEEGLDKKVVFTGQRQDTPDLLSAMDVFVFPSVHEALPITLIEAQANGLPCIVSDCITNEMDVIDSFRRLSLNVPVEVWADMIHEYENKRKTTMDPASFADFNIELMKETLQNIYKGLCNY